MRVNHAPASTALEFDDKSVSRDDTKFDSVVVLSASLPYYQVA